MSEKLITQYFKFEVGETVKDIVTGFTGVIMGVSHYLTGCDHYGLLPKKLNKEGVPADWKWFDESRLVRLKVKKVVVKHRIVELKVETKGKTKKTTRKTSGIVPNPPEM